MRILIGFLLAAQCWCQSAAPVQPIYAIFFGGSYSHYATPAVAAAWVSFAAKIADKTYSYSSMDMTTTQASIRTGFARILTQQGKWSLLFVGDAGVLTSNSLVLGAFSGGPMVVYSPWGYGAVNFTAVMRVTSVTSTSVQPVFQLGIGKVW